MTVFNFLSWLYNVSSPRSRSQFIRKFLKLASAECAGDKKLCLKFTFNYLQNDGIVIMRLFSQNCGPVITCDVLRQIWSSYLRKFEPRKTDSSLLSETPNNSTTILANQRATRPQAERHKDTFCKRTRSHHLVDSSNGHMNHSGPKDPTTVVFLPPRHNGTPLDSPLEPHGLNM